METKEITAEMYEALKRPLPDEAVTKHPTKTFLSTIKAIYVTERLNDVFGCGKWQIRTEKIEVTNNGMVVAKTTLTIPEYGIYYECFGGNNNGGEGSKNFDLGDAYKGATTDALTKIGSYLGIGIDVFKGKQGHQQQQPQHRASYSSVQTGASKETAQYLSNNEKAREYYLNGYSVGSIEDLSVAQLQDIYMDLKAHKKI